MAVGTPDGSKYSCSPRAIATSLQDEWCDAILCEESNCITNLPRHTRAYSLLTILGPTLVSLRGANPHPPGPKALLRIRRYLISGRYIRPSEETSAIHAYTEHSYHTGLLLNVKRIYGSLKDFCYFLCKRLSGQPVIAFRPIIRRPVTDVQLSCIIRD